MHHNPVIAGMSTPRRRLIDPSASDSKGMAMAKRFTPRSPFAPCLLRQPTAVSSGNGFKANSLVKQVKERGIRTVCSGSSSKRARARMTSRCRGIGRGTSRARDGPPQRRLLGQRSSRSHS